MEVKHLGKYVNDHLAGSIAAVELLNHLISSNVGTERSRFFVELRKEIVQEQVALRDLLVQLGFKEKMIRKGAAWLSEKFIRVKLSLEDPRGDKLAQLEKLEALALGIDGKWALWRGLSTVADRVPAVEVMNLSKLEERAAEQRGRVEAVRLDAAREALAG
jgi:hypothetical protein